MEVFHTSFEAHEIGVTLYVVGFLCDDAVSRATELMVAAPVDIRTVRLDLRAVTYIDPHAFVILSRTLSRWRDARSGRVMIQFPRRSTSRASRHLHLVDQPKTMGMAVGTPMSYTI